MTKCMEENKMNWNRSLGISTGGVKSMVGINNWSTEICGRTK